MAARHVVVIGAGPAGLTAAWELARQGVSVTVVEKYHLVGGIARTERYGDYYFDIGGHRFFTKVEEVEALWKEWMADDFLLRPRLSRIYYDGKYFNYPLKAFNALFGLGIFQSVGILVSYIWSQFFPYKEEQTFEQWVSNRFGKRLYEIFFKTYTEKVWGIPCNEISAEWAAQRIKGLSLPTAIRNALFPPRGDVIKTLIEEFHYPKRGPGMMWERVTELLRSKGYDVLMETDAVRVLRAGERVTGVEVIGPDGRRVLACTDVISTMPLSELIEKFDPPPPKEIIQAARELSYRDFLTVVLIVDEAHLFNDNWIYIHSPEVRVGRIQNFKNWSPYMVPDESKTSLGLEYFCTEGDDLWNMSDDELVALGTREMAQIGMLRPESVRDGVVVRQQKAYPIYNAHYGSMLKVVKAWLQSFENFQTVGRNGLHKYNNQDHSMLTAILAVRNMVAGEQNDVWEVNTDRSYHEEVHLPEDEETAEHPVDILEA